MSRSGYNDDLDDDLEFGRWRGMVASAIRGQRGQRLLADLLIALDAMPEKSLVIGDLETKEGEVCALGALGKARGIDLRKMDPEDPSQVAAAFDIAECLAQEIAYMNDEQFDTQWNPATKRSEVMSPEERWVRMRAWVAGKIKATESPVIA
jgi:hypothetical protein